MRKVSIKRKTRPQFQKVKSNSLSRGRANIVRKLFSFLRRNYKPQHKREKMMLMLTTRGKEKQEKEVKGKKGRKIKVLLKVEPRR